MEKIDIEFSPIEKSSDEGHFFVSSKYRRWSSQIHVWQPPTDVFEIKGTIVVQIEIAGMHDAEFTLSLGERTLKISGTRPSQEEQGAYHQMEIPSGDFISVVELPKPVDYDKVEAIYQDGFLRVILPIITPTEVKVK